MKFTTLLRGCEQCHNVTACIFCALPGCAHVGAVLKCKVLALCSRACAVSKAVLKVKQGLAAARNGYMVCLVCDPHQMRSSAVQPGQTRPSCAGGFGSACKVPVTSVGFALFCFAWELRRCSPAL